MERSFSELTPMELNQVLSQIHSNMPNVDPYEDAHLAVDQGLPDETVYLLFDEAVDVEERRGRSGHREKLLQRLDELLLRAECTDFLRTYIKRAFKTEYSMGRIEAGETVPFSISWIRGEGGAGIFEKRTAKILELRAYMGEIWNLKWREELVNRITSKKVDFTDQREYLQQWGETFFEFYGDKPDLSL